MYKPDDLLKLKTRSDITFRYIDKLEHGRHLVLLVEKNELEVLTDEELGTN